MQINAGWAVFDIIIDHPVMDDEDHKCFAHVDFETHELTIDGTLSDECARQSVLHEVWHILWEGIGYGDLAITEDTVKLNNEHLTESATKGMILFWRLNQKLWHLLWDSVPRQSAETRDGA